MILRIGYILSFAYSYSKSTQDFRSELSQLYYVRRLFKLNLANLKIEARRYILIGFNRRHGPHGSDFCYEQKTRTCDWHCYINLLLSSGHHIHHASSPLRQSINRWSLMRMHSGSKFLVPSSLKTKNERMFFAQVPPNVENIFFSVFPPSSSTFLSIPLRCPPCPKPELPSRPPHSLFPTLCHIATSRSLITSMGMKSPKSLLIGWTPIVQTWTLNSVEPFMVSKPVNSQPTPIPPPLQNDYAWYRISWPISSICAILFLFFRSVMTCS